MTCIRVPGWGFGYSEARYYGWRHCVQVGPLIVFFWPFREA